MRRRICALIILVVLALSISVQAVAPRIVSARPGLSFNGTTAFCSVICRGDSDNDTIDVTLTLYQGSTYVDSWSDSGKGRVALSGTCEAVSGKNYKLVVDYSVNGESKPSVYTTRQCP
jgi:spore coat protein U-like protein